MSGHTYIVPLAAVRQGATADGNVALTRLAAEHAEFRPEAVAEETPHGWVATVTYSKPGHPGRVLPAHIRLVWTPEQGERG
jgi:hypothetical protein